MELKLILFDYGGVIAPEGFQLGILNLSLKFGISYSRMYNIAGYEASLKSGFTAGKIDESRYWEILADLLQTKEDLSDLKYLFLDNFQPRALMIDLIKDLKNYFKTGIFSDQTNWIYELDSKYDFFKYFDYKFISYDQGFTKHDDEFFSIPLRHTGMDPEQILIIDDKQRVVEKAKQFGYKTYHFTAIESCISFLETISPAG
ncbi:HAD-IA family hydrolase [Elusimicrobiota bacterium]